ncbi:MAG: DUF5317 domain-containing protein, partial [Actinomycetota bacterium]|nr:DUF5317 domain-containing protein [Actinomycetota bacterium]
MKLMLVFLAVSAIVGLVLGGRVRNLRSMRIRWPGLAIVGFALQLVTGPGDTVPLVCLYVSFVSLTVFAVKNVRTAGFPLILIGVVLNFAVIGLNQGMPVARQALIASDQVTALNDLIDNPYPKHHLATDDDLVLFLGDVIGVPAPVRQAISIGDIFTYGGVGLVIVFGMRAPSARREDEPESGGSA